MRNGFICEHNTFHQELRSVFEHTIVNIILPVHYFLYIFPSETINIKLLARNESQLFISACHSDNCSKPIAECDQSARMRSRVEWIHADACGFGLLELPWHDLAIYWVRRECCPHPDEYRIRMHTALCTRALSARNNHTSRYRYATNKMCKNS